jgi:DNA invertase Pin-like site-specific DNA recombinase
METPVKRAAEYMRMSTEHQQYSIANQSAAIQEYANKNSIEIVRTYVDRGKSGLALAGRPELQSLLSTVTSGAADFTLLLVYDVSRWGRFQDVDEGAYYEYQLKKAGVRLIYCAEPFRDGGGPTDALIKTLKRAMAAEYSRELSVKVSEGQRRIAKLGFRLGGPAGFGFERVAVEPGGSRRVLLRDGERKGIKTDRVTLTQGPKEEIRTARKIFSLFVDAGFGERKIARHINERGMVTRKGKPWSRETVHRILIDPKYVGDLLYNRTVSRMGSLAVPNARENWTYVPNQFPAVISREVWNKAQDILRQRAERRTETDMLSRLRVLFAKHGRLSYHLIDAEPGMLSAQTYHKRFGSILEAYRRVGWKILKHGVQAERRPEVRACRRALEENISTQIAAVADRFEKHPKAPIWTINDDLSIYVALVVGTVGRKRRPVWRFRWRLNDRRPKGFDVLVIARSPHDAGKILDYYVFPGRCKTPIRIFEDNPWAIEIHRSDDLSFLDLICRHTTLSRVGGSNA